LLIFYVDNILIFYYKEHSNQARTLIKGITTAYKIEDQGLVLYFLSVRVICNCTNCTITLSYNTYIDKVATKFDLKDSTSFLDTLLGSAELCKNIRFATKQQIKSY
jgi:hypothetical protein